MLARGGGSWTPRLGGDVPWCPKPRAAEAWQHGSICVRLRVVVVGPMGLCRHGRPGVSVQWLWQGMMPGRTQAAP